ncbi:MAG: VOC family protein [Pseudomonadota bacterium]
MKIVPELLCSDLETTRAFYVEAFGFEVKYERPAEKFVYFTLDGIDLMCEEAAGPGRRWLTGPLEPPFGRGVNFQWDVTDVVELYHRVQRTHPHAIYLALETKRYATHRGSVQQRQFIAQDPDGYLFRFCDQG